MANNLFISYDLIAPGQHYPAVQDAIKSLGQWGKIEFSMFYVNSALSPEDAAKRVWASMTANDKLIVIDSTNNNFYGYNMDKAVLALLQSEWYK
jgi:hypothetical protein